MDINEKMAKEIAAQLGLGNRGGLNFQQETLKKLEGKSDQELAREIMKLKEQLKKNHIGPQQQKALVQNLMPMMNGEQKMRLEQILKMLE